VAFVFACVLIEQAGAPIPAYPALLVAGSLAARGQLPVGGVLAAAVVAAVLADLAWYGAGRRFGHRILKLMCRVSLSADVCVRQTKSVFARFGAPSLVVAKFVPGFASVATAMAGSTRVPRLQFLAYDTVGAALWAGLGLWLGWLFSDAVTEVLAVLEQMGRWGLLFLAVALGAFIAAKAWRRHQFRARLRMDRISVGALSDLLSSGLAPVVVDARSPDHRREGRIPGAIAFDGDRSALVADHPDAVVVVYCACPNEAGAASLARQLMRRGFKRVRPLQGGIEAWKAAGLRMEFDGAMPAAA
jgi:membrane protein DedA with SNARE-associated domain/rhodanese-related sulfurtransferase